MLVVGASDACAQAAPAATQTIQLSVFGGFAGLYTGYDAGRNLSLTGGLDMGFQPKFSLFPSVEMRGSLPIDKGQIDNQRNILVGPQVAKHYGRVRPYAAFLFGRGQINYPNGADTPARNAFYVQSTSAVYSPGLGIDFELDDHFALKADAQFQRYSAPVADSGHVVAKVFTLGVVYHFSFGRR